MLKSRKRKKCPPGCVKKPIRKASRKRRSVKRKASRKMSRKRRSAKKKASRKRKSTKNKFRVIKFVPGGPLKWGGNARRVVDTAERQRRDQEAERRKQILFGGTGSLVTNAKKALEVALERHIINQQFFDKFNAHVILNRGGKFRKFPRGDIFYKENVLLWNQLPQYKQNRALQVLNRLIDQIRRE